MKTKYFIGDSTIPWWVEELAHQGLIEEIRENAAITFFMTFKHSFTDTKIHYLYEGDYLELDEETGAVTIGYSDWRTALAKDFQKINWDKFVNTLKRTAKDREQKKKDEEEYLNSYWS